MVQVLLTNMYGMNTQSMITMVHADLIPEQVENQRNQISDAGSGKGADPALYQGIRAGISQDRAVDSADPQRNQGRRKQQQQRAPQMDNVPFRNAEGKIEFH